MATTVFKCGNCGRTFSLDTSNIPPTGARGTCQACSEPIAIYPDGRVQGATLVTADAGPEVPAQKVQRPQGESPVEKTPPQGKSAFFCPSCGHKHVVDISKIPPGGGKGKCAGCGVLLLFKPDESVVLAESTKSEKPTGPSESTVQNGQDEWYLKQGAEALGPFRMEQLKGFAREGGLTPEREIRQKGGEWVKVASIGALVDPTEHGSPDEPESDVPWGNEDECCIHPERVPARKCSRCERYLCEECLTPMKRGGPNPLLVCPVCGGTTIVLKRREKWPPFYTDLGQVFGSPFKKGALLYFVLLTGMELAQVPCRFALMIGIIAIIILVSFQWVFYVHVVRAVANGSYYMPDWPEASDMMDMIVNFLKVVAVCIISLIPAIILACIGGIGIGAMAGVSGTSVSAMKGPMALLGIGIQIFYMLYLPVCIAIVALFDTVVPALNPILIFRIIGRIGKPYLYAVALWGSLYVFSLVITSVLLKVGMGGLLLAAPFEVYFTLVAAYILGRVCYENESKLGWH